MHGMYVTMGVQERAKNRERMDKDKKAKRLVMGEEAPTDTEIREPNKQVNRINR